MGLGIVVLLIGIPIGLFMLCKPRQTWWTFESWKYNDPEANEPSEAAYGLSALRGLGVIAGAIILALLAFTRPDDASGTRTTTSVSSTTWTPYTGLAPAPPQDRGAIPIVGYQIRAASGGRHADGKTYLDISYLVPDGADPAAGEANSQPRSGCEVIPKVGGLGTDRLTVDLRLYWSNPYGYNTPAAEQTCRLNGNWSPNVGTMRLTEASMEATILTDGSIVDRDGTVLLPAASGNAVPKLDT